MAKTTYIIARSEFELIRGLLLISTTNRHFNDLIIHAYATILSQISGNDLGGEHIHIFVFYVMHFPRNRLFLWSVNMNI